MNDGRISKIYMYMYMFYIRVFGTLVLLYMYIIMYM